MLLPPDGLVMPVRYVRCESGHEVRIALTRPGPTHLVRLAGCRATGGLAAREAADLALGDARQLHLALPLSHPDYLLACLPRPLRGHLFLNSDETLSQYLVRLGLAEWEADGAR
jgi:hypothetical protein